MKNLEDAPNAKNTQASLTHVAESNQLSLMITTTLSDDEIWQRFKKAQQELNQLLKETKNENKHRN